VAEPITFSNLKVDKYIAPLFPVEKFTRTADIGSNGGYRLELRDLQNRLKKKWRIEVDTWNQASGQPIEATLTAIHDLVENAGLTFGFISPSTGLCYVEIRMPRAPHLGPFRVTVGKMRAGIIDAWAPKAEPLRWRRLPNPVQVDPGKTQLQVLQLSDIDAPILLRSFRLIPAGETNTNSPGPAIIRNTDMESIP
jgi:hypothetical protein